MPHKLTFSLGYGKLDPVKEFSWPGLEVIGDASNTRTRRRFASDAFLRYQQVILIPPDFWLLACVPSSFSLFRFLLLEVTDGV
jgi:hypothetical protein